MTDLKSAAKTGVIDAVKLPKEIPPEKQQQMAGSVVAGLGLILLGLLPMALAIGLLWVRLKAGDPPLLTLVFIGVVFLVGLALALVGANIASNQVVKNGLLAMREPLDMLLRFWRAFKNGRNGNGNTPGPTA